MNVRELFDPAHATLGFCSAGAAVGGYLGLFPVASEGGSVTWDAAVSVPVPSEGLFRGDSFELDPDRSDDVALLEGWGVVSVPEPAASRGLHALFADSLVNSKPRFQAGVSGRLASGEALRVAVSALVSRDADLSESDVPIRLDGLETSLDRAQELIDQVSALLAAHQYSLAIVPLRVERSLLVDEPWGEFLA